MTWIAAEFNFEPLIMGNYVNCQSFPDSSVGEESAFSVGPWFNSWVRKIPWRRDRLPTLVFSGFPCGSAGKESACNAGDLGLIPGLERSPGEGKGYPLQYSGLENSMDYIAHGVQRAGHDWATFTLNFETLIMGNYVSSQRFFKMWTLNSGDLS